MGSTTINPVQNAPVKPVPLADQKRVAVPESQADQTRPVVTDTVELSRQSLALSQASGKQANAASVPIVNGAQAQSAVERVATEIRNNPEQSRAIYSKVAQVNLNQLLN